MRRISRGPGAELGEEDLGGHGDGELAALHGFGTFVGGFELRVHPLVGEEAGAIFGDAVAAHEADGLAHHVGAVAGVPELGGGAEDVGFGVFENELHERVGLRVRHRAGDRRRWSESNSMARCSLSLRAFHLGAAALDAALLEDGGLLLFEGVELVEEARGGKAEGGGGFAGGPDIDEAVECVFALLNALLVADGARAWRLRLRGSAGAGSG